LNKHPSNEHNNVHWCEYTIIISILYIIQIRDQ